MKLHQAAAFLRAYHLLPHRLLNQACAQLMTAKRPAAAVQAAIRWWIRSAGIDMSDFASVPYQTIEAFFLRELKAGARPIAEGIVCPVDGEVFATGSIAADSQLSVKGQVLSVSRLVNGHGHAASLAEYEGGCYVAIFLSPRGYHHIHAPVAAKLVRSQWIPGRYFPQNAVALQHIPAVYERNERAALFWQTSQEHGAQPFITVLVGASMVGGIELEELPQSAWQTAHGTDCSRGYEKGQRFAHFRFGSTVVVLFSKSMVDRLLVKVGDAVLMGQPLAQPSAR